MKNEEMEEVMFEVVKTVIAVIVIFSVKIMLQPILA
jgi:hypothetical protein